MEMAEVWIRLLKTEPSRRRGSRSNSAERCPTGTLRLPNAIASRGRMLRDIKSHNLLTIVGQDDHYTEQPNDAQVTRSMSNAAIPWALSE
jgi:hypothetical protein